MRAIGLKHDRSENTIIVRAQPLGLARRHRDLNAHSTACAVDFFREMYSGRRGELRGGALASSRRPTARPRPEARCIVLS